MEKVTDIIIGMIKDLKNDINSRFDKMETEIKEIKTNMVTKEECKENKCDTLNLEVLEKKEEWTVKKITAITGLIVAAIGGIAGIVKLLIDGI